MTAFYYSNKTTGRAAHSGKKYSIDKPCLTIMAKDSRHNNLPLQRIFFACFHRVKAIKMR